MFNRRRLRRERLEVYLVYLIMMYRRLILISGMALLVYAFAVMAARLPAGPAILAPAVFLLALGSSFKAVLLAARLGAWIGTLWVQDE